MRVLAHATVVGCLLFAAGDASLAARLAPSERTRVEGQSSAASVREMLDRYPAHVPDFSHLKTERDVEQLREQFEREAPGWIRTGDAAATRRREIAAATFGLEIARAGFDVAWSQGRRLIAWGSTLLRHSPRPDEGERLWHLAALTLMQGAVDYRLLVELKDDVWLKRFPNEPRLLFALLVLLEGDTWPEPDRGVPWDSDEVSLELGHKMYQARRVNRSGNTADMRAKSFEFERRQKMRQVMTLLEDLSNATEIRADAILRLGVLHLRLQHPEVARDQFEDVLRLTSEPFLVYLAHFFTGQALERDGERAAAIDAYRAALAAMPRAQSASFALASLRFIQDRRDEASKLIDAAIQLPTAPDPWRSYQTGDFRLWPERVSALRKMLQ
jgi:tetratricopeptide (TPR) repeat protein